jgi:hypothetical protein
MTPEESQRLMAVSRAMSAAGNSLQAPNSSMSRPNQAPGFARLVIVGSSGVNTLCSYSDGTAIRIRGGLCPLSN